MKKFLILLLVIAAFAFAGCTDVDSTFEGKTAEEWNFSYNLEKSAKDLCRRQKDDLDKQYRELQTKYREYTLGNKCNE